MMTTRPIASTLPDEYLRLIGDMCVSWSILESKLRTIVYMMLAISPAPGRLAVRSARAKEMIELISDLAMAEGHTLTFNGASVIDEIENRRNKIVHGIWFDDGSGGYLLQETGGKMPMPGHPGVKVNKRILPAGVTLKLSDLQHLASRTREAIQHIDAVGLEIEAFLKTSKRKRPAQLPTQGSPGQ